MTVATDLHVEVDWNRDLDFADTYDDITDLVLSIQTATGGSGSSITGKVDAGRAIAILNNDDDRFSNFNAASPLMTVPTFVAAGTSSTANGVAPTPGLPAGMANGDCMVCVFYSREATDATVSLPSPAWKELYNERSSSGLLAVWRRIYQTGDVAPTFTVSGLAAGDDCIAQIAAWDNVDRSRPITVKGAISTNGSAQDIGAITGITLPAKSMLVVIGGKADDWTSVATLSQSGMTFAEIGEPDTTTGNDAGLVWDYGTVDAGTALAITNKTFAVTGGGSAVGKGVMFALNPEPQVRQGALMRLRDDTDVLGIWRLSKITPSVLASGEKRARIEASGIFDEMAKLQVVPLASEGDTTGAIIADALDDAGIESGGIDAGEITTGPFGTSGTSKVSLLSEVQKVAEHELGPLYEDQESYRPLFKARSNRPSNTTSLATFSDDPGETLHYEGIEQPDWTGNIFNRCKAGVSPYTVGSQETLVTLPGPYTMNPSGTTNLIAQYSDRPLISFNGHTRDIYYGSTVPAYSSTTSAGSVSTNTSHSFTLPATLTANDLMLCFLITTRALTEGLESEGFTQKFAVTISATCYFYIYAKNAIGTEDGASVGITLATTGHYVSRILRFTGWHGNVSQIDISAQATGTSTTVDAPSLTPSFGALAEMFIAFYLHETTSGGTPTPPSGYTDTTTAGTNGDANFMNITRRSESTGVTSEDPAAWGALFTSETWYAYTLAIRGVRSVSADVTDTVPSTRDGAFTIAYDGSVGGGVGYQDHENIRVSGVALTEGDGTFSQADYLPSQDILTGVGIRTYPSPAGLFATVDDAQEYADIIVDRAGEGYPVMRMRYTANKNADLYAAAIALKVNDRITLEANNNAGLGVQEDFFIEAIYREISPGQLHRVTYLLSPASVSDE